MEICQGGLPWVVDLSRGTALGDAACQGDRTALGDRGHWGTALGDTADIGGLPWVIQLTGGLPWVIQLI